ncbi:uncharacterized protein LOC120079252 [Benincasa hispida]|uniref:uncharacterized protein LOC120079252 n=1 Tax=Benincasa hispida TaxID=102211 RepID=UPI0019008554|nr:uncharacterized protein LOC120079252 [Benincasa hispida]
MIQNAGQFRGLQGEDPHAHLTSFVEMCGNFSLPGLTLENIRLYLFPYTLRDEAKKWAYSLEPNEITSWGQLVERIPDCVLMETFYNGLNSATQAVVDASATGGFMDKTYTESKVILDRISRNMDDWIDYRYGGRGAERRKAETAIVPVETMTTLAAQMATVTSILQSMAINQGAIASQSAQPVALAHVAVIGCVNCGGAHGAEGCPLNLQQSGLEESSELRLGWQSQPRGTNEPSGGNRENPPFHNNKGQSRPQNQQPSSSSNASGGSLEALLKQYMDKNNAVMQAQASSIRNLEIQVGQLASELRSQTLETLPSNSEAPGSTRKEQCL